jgi:FtsP/CotA-like multicopper oxidase with cupredoxin domain
MAISRRNLLIAGGIGAAALATTATAVTLEQASVNANKPTLLEPPMLRSKYGLLDMTLTASYVDRTVDGKNVRMMAYNGTVPGPTIQVQPGDKLRIKFVNQLGETTNLHTHGLHVSPEGNSDNPMIMIHDGETFQYEYQIPADHPAGTYWYHPHHHGQVANQVYAGLYGAIIVAGPMGGDARTLVISDTSFATDGSVAGANMMSIMMGREGDVLMVNGATQPWGSMDRTTERWRIINACTSRNLSLTVSGGEAIMLARDGHQLSAPELNAPATDVLLSPGNRVDVLVTNKGGDISLNYTTVAHPDSMGMGGMGMNTTTYKNYPLATFKDSGKTVVSAFPYISKAAELEDLRTATPATSREFVLNMPGMTGMMGMMGSGVAGLQGHFTINGQAFDANRIDTATKLGDVEEWTIINQSTMAHPFHLHVWPMQIINENGTDVGPVRYQDVVNIPAKGRVKVRLKFNDFAGTSVYHCHILDHEDLGMMGLIQVS